MPFISLLDDDCDDDVAVLWHFDADLFDASGNAGFSSTGVFDSSVYKWPGGSMKVTASGTAATYDFGPYYSGSWTLDAWVRCGTGGQIQLYLETNKVGIDYSAGGGVIVWHLENNSIVNEVKTAGIVADTFQHVAIVRDKDAGTYALYFDGARLSLVNDATDVSDGGSNDINLVRSIADGYVDDIRFSSVARYSGTTYTVPAAAFVDPCPPADPVVVWHFDDDFYDTNDIYEWTGTGRAISGTAHFGAGALTGSSSLIQVPYDIGPLLQHSWTVTGWGRTSFFAVHDFFISRPDGAVQFRHSQVGTPSVSLGITTIGSSGTITLPSNSDDPDVYYHWAIVRNEDTGNYELYFNGARLAQIASGDDMIYDDPYNLNTTSSGTWMNDEIAVFDYARYTGATYRVPTEPF